MYPKDVHVVYDAQADTIHSVHAFKETAYAERNRIMRVVKSTGKECTEMSFVITDLEEALTWMLEVVELNGH